MDIVGIHVPREIIEHILSYLHIPIVGICRMIDSLSVPMLSKTRDSIIGIDKMVILAVDEVSAVVPLFYYDSQWIYLHLDTSDINTMRRMVKLSIKGKEMISGIVFTTSFDSGHTPYLLYDMATLTSPTNSPNKGSCPKSLLPPSTRLVLLRNVRYTSESRITGDYRWKIIRV
jgi:hypothetical protein